MADVKIRVIGEDAASQQLKRVDKALDDVAKSAAGANKPAANLISTLSSAAAKIGPFIAAGAALKKAFDLGRQGAELEFVREKFDRLTASIGSTSDAMLSRLREATRGLSSDSELIASAADFMTLGLAKTENQVVRLTRVAGALGMDMNQLVLTLTNQTTMRFDALGVSVDGFQEKVNKLKAAGMSANDAFKEAFLQQAEEQIARVGEKADSSAAAFERMDAAIADAGDAIRTKLTPASTVWADAISRAARDIEAIAEGRQGSSIAVAPGNPEAAQRAREQMRANRELAASIDRLAESQRRLLADQEKQELATRSTAVAWDQATVALMNQANAQAELKRRGEELAAQKEREAEALEQARRAAEDYARAIQEAATAGNVNLGLGGQLGGLIEQINYLQAGGGAIQQAAAQAQLDYKNLPLTLQQDPAVLAEYERQLQDIAAAHEALMVQLGEQTRGQGEANVRAMFPKERAEAAMQEFYAALEAARVMNENKSLDAALATLQANAGVTKEEANALLNEAIGDFQTTAKEAEVTQMALGNLEQAGEDALAGMSTGAGDLKTNWEGVKTAVDDNQTAIEDMFDKLQERIKRAITQLEGLKRAFEQLPTHTEMFVDVYIRQHYSSDGGGGRSGTSTLSGGFGPDKVRPTGGAVYGGQRVGWNEAQSMPEVFIPAGNGYVLNRAQAERAMSDAMGGGGGGRGDTFVGPVMIMVQGAGQSADAIAARINYKLNQLSRSGAAAGLGYAGT
jgi:hypothetical protein